MRDMDRMDKEQLFPSVEGSVVSGQRFEMRDGRIRGDVRKNFFTQRVVTGLECLAWRVVEASCLTSFKKYLDEHLAHHNIQGYGPSAGR